MTSRRSGKLRVLMLGLRGFPGVQGGIETHVESLSAELVKLGCDVEVIVRSPYMRHISASGVGGVTFARIWCPRSKHFEALVHSALGVLWAARRRPDVLHIHGIGPAAVTPLAKLLRLRVVVTHHGRDYEREKWGGLARAVLKAGEWWGMGLSAGRIAVSRVVAEGLRRQRRLDVRWIPNGVRSHKPATSTGALDTFGLTKGRYILTVGRLVEEKRHLDLLEAFERSDLQGWKLVVVGTADHQGDYHRRLQEQMNRQKGVIATGFQSGVALQELYSHAGLFVLPSSHEGLPIALLEALSYGVPALATDIPANLEVGLADDRYFPLGDVDALAGRLRWACHARELLGPSVAKEVVERRYNWPSIAATTLDLYREVLTVEALDHRRHASPEINGLA